MALQTRIKTIYKKQILSSKFAEEVTFRASGETNADNDRTITMSLTPRQQVDNPGDEISVGELDELEAFMLRDESDADVGGVDALSYSDRFTRSSTYDPSSVPFTFKGEILERGQHYIRAIFSRKRQEAQGPGAPA